MPRNHHPAASTLRNRNRITNKTRLKIHQGSLDADAILIPDEDEEKHRLTNLVAGVDAEDANEHHLQEVLSAVHRTNVINRQPRGSVDKPAPAPAPAFIPTPDSTGIVENYDELYPPNRWKDPTTYVHTSQTVEEHITNGLANGFTYYMDERDKEWLDKNNEEARGEGTSAQGAVSASGTRTSARSAKAKGKEPESSLPVVISEDEFELVMGIFEKVTHEKTEYLHHSLETGMEFPAFSEYQDVFSATLPVTMFATYSVPSWIPTPQALLKSARAIYPYWKERRLERGGHRIIPTLNGDESDTLNESYICFRRRESKAVRKTRASQVTSSDKLARLQAEFSYPLELAKAILTRETLKKELAAQSQAVWEKRLAFVDLKRKFPSLNDKIDEELLVDKERPTKRADTARVPGLKIRTSDQALPPPRQEVVIRPKERQQMIRDQIESQLARIKDLDHHWEDQVDNPYQSLPVPYASRLFKYIPPPNTPSWPSSNSDKTDDEATNVPPRISRAVRMRVGRGGRILLDRRDAVARRPVKKLPRSSLFALGDSEDESAGADGMDVDEDPEEIERNRRLEERWRFDEDDVPPTGPEGPDEQDRILVDDYNPTYLRHTMTLFNESDHVSLMTDPTVYITAPDGRQLPVVPYRLGMPAPAIRRDAQGRPYPIQQHIPPNHPLANMVAPGGIPVSMQHQIKKMQPPTAAPQMRISSNGGMRPPAVMPLSNIQQAQHVNGAVPHHVASPHPVPVPVPQHPPANGVNGISRAAISMPHVDVQKPEVIATPAIANGVPANPQPDPNAEMTVNGLPIRPKSQNVTPQPHLGLGVPTNGYHLTPMNNMTAAALVNSAAFQHNQGQQQIPTGLSLQQVQNLKNVFANMPAPELAAFQAARGIPNSYMLPANGANMNMQLAQGANMNLKLPPARQMQWMNSPLQRPPSVVNGTDTQINGAMVASPSISHSVPVRSPSANGQRPVMRNGVHMNGQHSMSPHMQHSPSPLPNISQSQSPPRVPMTPNMAMTSPSLQQQQPVGGQQNGY
ncbi:Enhancer of polycomb-like protein 1 [Psilocybe cubensis]|uniref:Enhancer of polycomb-like protein 1 n=2 Tax=Psilocybe cubensis TaxID=181762 RepID=A0ACB8GHN8_PSICU|nr:Enhancer of polycomb-like protein 1 [Psilocybe cubensis]KAH9475176.1 Enhancer of polycomb-like protein 1 [Psilocybe cubensis]